MNVILEPDPTRRRGKLLTPLSNTPSVRLSVAAIVGFNTLSQIRATIRFPTLIWRNADVQQSVAITGNTAVCRYAWGDFLEPPKIDAIHSGNWRWLTHDFRSAVGFLGVKFEHLAFLADFFSDFIHLQPGFDGFWK